MWPITMACPISINKLTYEGTKIATDFDKAVSWAHTFTNEADPTKDYCLNCHKNNTSNATRSRRRMRIGWSTP